MKIHFNSIRGLDDALCSMYLSKRTWTEERDTAIRESVQKESNPDGSLKEEIDPDLQKKLSIMFKIGSRHMTLLRFINFSVTVEGLHRAGQDDFDSHAKRLDNRIIRSSTRLAKFGENEMSDYYRGKIITTDEALRLLQIRLPDEIEVSNKQYVRAVNGYVLKEEADNKDVLRGLYMLSIPSTFIFECNVTEWAHIYKERNKDSTANPEVKEMCEAVTDALEKACPWITRELLLKIPN